MTEQQEKKKSIWLQYLIGYLLFFALCGLAAFLIFRVRLNLVQFGFLMDYNRVQVKGISNIGVMIFALLVLVGVVFLEDYLRKGIQNGTFWKRFFRSLIVEAVLILITFVFTLVYLLLAGS